MPWDEMTVLIDGLQPPGTECTPVLAGEDAALLAFEEEPRERPIHQPHRVLETHTPVDAARIRALREPRVEQCPATERIALLSCQVPRLRERHQLEMPVELPKVLDIADQRRIAIIELLAENQRRLGSRARVDIPARGESQLQIAQREHVKLPIQDPIRRAPIARDVELAWQLRQPRLPALPRRY